MLKPCCVDGCTKQAKSTDKYCSMHRARVSRTNRLDLKTPYERMMERVVVEEGGCWTYTAYKTECGYGRLRANGKKTLAPRLSYAEHFGDIPSGMLVLHKCDNPSCVNPSHLYLGTQKDNMVDMAQRGRNWLQRAKNQGLNFKISKGEMPNGYQKIS